MIVHEMPLMVIAVGVKELMSLESESVTEPMLIVFWPFGISASQSASFTTPVWTPDAVDVTSQLLHQGTVNAAQACSCCPSIMDLTCRLKTGSHNRATLSLGHTSCTAC